MVVEAPHGVNDFLCTTLVVNWRAGWFSGVSSPCWYAVNLRSILVKELLEDLLNVTDADKIVN